MYKSLYIFALCKAGIAVGGQYMFNHWRLKRGRGDPTLKVISLRRTSTPQSPSSTSLPKAQIKVEIGRRFFNVIFSQVFF
jgi:hypothetical protein